MSAAKKRGLGRSFGEIVANNTPREGVVLELAINSLKPSTFQPREKMDVKSLENLAKTIAERGILQPILVRPIKSGHEIIAGERRWRAAKLAGMRSVPVVVREFTDQDALLAALVENIQREDLNPLDQATASKRIIAELKLNITDAAKSLGMNRASLSNLIRLLELEPTIQKMLQNNQISASHGRALLALPQSRRLKVAKEIVAQDLSVREIEAMAKKTSRKTKQATARKVSRDTQRLCEELSGRLGMQVNIAGSGKTGKLTISYRSLESLDALIMLLRKFK